MWGEWADGVWGHLLVWSVLVMRCYMHVIKCWNFLERPGHLSEDHTYPNLGNPCPHC